MIYILRTLYFGVTLYTPLIPQHEIMIYEWNFFLIELLQEVRESQRGFES
jgi:hypothetical protein